MSEETQDVKIDDLSDEQIDQMGADDLNRVEFDEETGDGTLKKPAEEKPDESKKDESGEEPPADEKKPPADKEDDKPEEGEKPEEKKEPSLDDQITELENIPKEDRTDVQTVELRRLNAERRMHKATQEAAELKRENADLKKKQYEVETEKAPEFEELSEEEEKELKETDPDEYNTYQQEKQNYQEYQDEKIAQTAQSTFTNIAAFYKGLKGKTDSVEDLLKLETNGDGTQQLANAEFREFLASKEFKAVDKELTDHGKRQYDGTYSAQQMMNAHFIVNKDKILADAQLTGREQALKDIDRASTSDASKLDQIPKSDGKKGLKRISDLTDDEIENMSADELKSYESQMEQEGLA